LSTFVLDASVAIRWVLDKSAPAYAVRIEQLLLHGDRALVPNLWHLEIANSLAVAERRHLLRPAELDMALQRIEVVLQRSVDIDMTLTPVRVACSIARSWQLSGYDASYLHLAQRTGLPLASLDAALIAAAHRCGVGTV
jgi:predicted nucleic acid-binding protein